MTIYSYDNTLPIAVSNSGNLAEFGYTGFENGEGYGWSYENKIITYGDAHTGVKVAEVYGPKANATDPQKISRKRTVWMRTPVSRLRFG